MKVTLLFYGDNVSEFSKFEADLIEFQLIPRNQVDIFVTLWYEMDREDCDFYDSIRFGKSYLKVLDNNEKLLYSGTVLDVHEMQAKFKHLTRQDLSLKARREIDAR